ncbi:MAG: Gfo/Idh/MocA family oxidoreductase [Planctomycetaceae bacterium]|nr:Gfo/Idh/MocA family oxidoreductase [Planctomycetaceae bacterium]
MFLSPEEKAIGKENFYAALGSKPIRRELIKKAIKADVRPGAGLGSLYFGYGDSVSSPVRVGVLGTGDEGSVLLGAINPKYIEVKAIADIRPYNVWRAFHGDYSSEAARKARPGLMSVYDWKSEDEARQKVKVYGAYEDLLANAKQDGIEAIVIALPLHLHAQAAVAAMRAGLDVLTEKLMGHSVRECKEMARVADQTNLLLAVGHQRHYNILYDDASDMIRKGLLGNLHSIRAQWNRGNLPGADSWQPPMPAKVKPDDPQAGKLERNLQNMLVVLNELKRSGKPTLAWENRIAQLRAQLEDAVVDAKKFGYQDGELKDGSGKVVYRRPAIEELIRWRLWNQTGAGLMAELGSHQLDAASIFIAAAHGGQKQYPLNVAASSNRSLFPYDRDVEDHVYCVFEFPAPGYNAKDPIAARKKIGVQYASINGNGFGGYGETVLGTEGTLLLETEKDPMLYRTQDTLSKTRVVVPSSGARKGVPTLQVDDDGDQESEAIGALGALPADRGYTEELEHWAWCIRNRDPNHQPHCNPKVALGDAVIALTTNMAARRGERIDFKPEWFDVHSDETPDGDKPDVSRYK